MKLCSLDHYEWSLPVPLHKRDNYGLFVVTGGDGTITVGTTPNQTRRGDAVIYFPMEDHGYAPAEGSSLAATAVRFELGPEDEQLRRDLMLMDDVRLFPGFDPGQALLEQIEPLMLTGNLFDTRAAAALVQSMLYQLIGTLRKSEMPVDISLLDSIVQYLYSDYSATLTSLSEHFGVSQEYIRRLFRRHLNDTPMHYIMRYKIEHLTPLLTDSHLSLEQIAERYCFSDASHLSRAFKRYTGMSPAEYRRKHRG